MIYRSFVRGHWAVRQRGRSWIEPGGARRVCARNGGGMCAVGRTKVGNNWASHGTSRDVRGGAVHGTTGGQQVKNMYDQ